MTAAVLAVLTALAPGQDDADGPEEFFRTFGEYIVANKASRGTILPEEGKVLAAKEAQRLHTELLSDPEKLVALLLRDVQSNGQYVHPRWAIHFLNQEGIGKERVLPVVREIVDKTTLAEMETPTLSTAVRYLSAHGDESDIDRLRRASGHFNPGIAGGSRYAIKQIENRALARKATDFAGKNPSERSKMGTGGSGDPGTPAVTTSGRLHNPLNWILIVLFSAAAIVGCRFCWLRFRKS